MDITFFETIRSIPGTAAKVAYAREHHTQLIDQIVADAMDPAITYGITSKDIVVGPQLRDSHWMGSAYDGFHSILERLASRELTGNAAIETITDYLKYHAEEMQRFLLQVLDRDLSLGIGWDTYRSEVLGLDDQFEVALAQHLEKVKGVNPVDGQWFASRKCDGCVSGDTLVEIDGVGALPISEVVERKLRGKIKSMDPVTGEVVYSDIVDWMHNVPDFDSAHKDWFLLELADGRSLKITGNDSVYVKDRGWTRADSLKEGDELLTGT